MAKTDPQCMTQVRSRDDGAIQHVDVFLIVDQGNDIFLNCAYHESLHAFGLTNHANSNPWTILNQNRTVGYLTVYDRIMLTILYDHRIKTGMSKTEVRRVLPEVIRDAGQAP